MPQKYSRRRAVKNKLSSSPTSHLIKEWSTEDILILVKTYPAISKKYMLTVCTAGISKDGKLLRLYPIKYFSLPKTKLFKKFQWISAKIQKSDNRDLRKESYKIDQDSIVLKDVVPSTEWKKRKQILKKVLSKSLCELKKEYDTDFTSIGIFKPKDIDFKVYPDSSDWPNDRKSILHQKSFLGEEIDLKKIPYKFKYAFHCNERACPGHELTITDWEISALYLNLKEKHGYAMDIILNKIKQKYLNQLWGKERDSYLIVGTTFYPYKEFVVIGVFWPPKEDEQISGQLALAKTGGDGGY